LKKIVSVMLVALMMLFTAVMAVSASENAAEETMEKGLSAAENVAEEAKEAVSAESEDETAEVHATETAEAEETETEETAEEQPGFNFSALTFSRAKGKKEGIMPFFPHSI
jgi:flagellar biosynthesis/type III secretory pathway M-ring protein FliF/YscJ